MIIDWVPYDCRHTFATRVVEETHTDLVTLAALLGHESPRCVHKYVHPSTQYKKKAMKNYDRTITYAKRKVTHT